MTTCLGKSCSFSLLCVSFVHVYQFLRELLSHLVFGGGMWDLIVLVLKHSFSFYMYFVRKKHILYL